MKTLVLTAKFKTKAQASAARRKIQPLFVKGWRARQLLEAGASPEGIAAEIPEIVYLLGGNITLGRCQFPGPDALGTQLGEVIAIEENVSDDADWTPLELLFKKLGAQTTSVTEKRESIGLTRAQAFLLLNNHGIEIEDHGDADATVASLIGHPPLPPEVMVFARGPHFLQVVWKGVLRMSIFWTEELLSKVTLLSDDPALEREIRDMKEGK